ncbi:MAG: sigma-70 family RNA polymerase sigma factor [Gemmatimonadaceae bacterium]
MVPANTHDVTRLLHEVSSGTDGASERLIRVVYQELHDLAVAYMRREKGDHTLQPTALVNEAYLRLIGSNQPEWKDRAHFFGIAARAMRRVLVDHARRKNAGKREAGERVTLDDQVGASGGRSLDLIALDDAMRKLAALEERQAQIVELRFFGGLDVEQTAEVLGVSPATVKRDWAFARAFLQRELDEAT